MMLPGAVWAGDTHEKLSDRVQAHAEISIEQLAREQKWPSYDLSVTPWVPNLSDDILSCKKQPIVERSDHARSLWGRVPYQISCSDPEWVIRARADVSLELPVAKTTRRIRKEERLTDDMIKLEKTNVSRVFGEFVTDKLELIGRQVLRSTRAGQAITRNMTSEPYWVEENVKVLIRVNQDGVIATMAGIAMDNGSKGDPVRVKNQSSGKTITAWVVDRGIVETRF